MISSGNEEEPQKKAQRACDRTDAQVHENEEVENSGPFNLGNGSRKKVSMTEFMGKVSSTT